MGGVVLAVIGIAFVVIWIKAVVEYDGSQPDFCKDCDPERCPFPCEKNMRK